MIVNTPSQQTPAQNLETISPPRTTEGVLPVGVFLGPGLIRSFVHIGVLKVFTQAQIPIVSIGGDEWGAIVAALYGFSKSGNDVEWQMLKLRKDQVPSAGGFLRGSDAETKDSGSLLQFLKFIFADKNLSVSKLPFGCLTSENYTTQYLRVGAAAEEILKCATLPPFYSAVQKKWISGAIAPSNHWAEGMARDGAKFLIYIDVLGDGALLNRTRSTKPDEAMTILTAMKATALAQWQKSNMVVRVPVQEDILNFEARRDLIRLGENFARGILPDIMKQIGMSSN